NHEGGEAERFYRDLKRKGIRVRVGMEATGYSRFRVVDRRSGRDCGATGQEAEDGPRGCATSAEANARRSLSQNLGTESGESRPATTAVAPTSHGADAHADPEPDASAGHERREALEIEAVEPT